MTRIDVAAVAGAVLLSTTPGLVHAQSLGTFTWQLTPYCNRVVAEVTQNGPHFEIDGFGDRCGAAQRAPLSGIATPNPDGTIGFGLTIVTLGGTAVHVDARMSLATLNGPWFDSAGNGGTFVLGGPGGGSPRPAAGLSTTTLAVSGAGAIGGTLSAAGVTTPGTVSAQHGVFSGDTSARFGSFSGGLGVDGFVSVAAPAPRITMIGAGTSGPSLEFLRSGGTVAAPTAAGSYLPELVTTDDDGFKRVDYSQLPLLAIQAINDLKRDNDTLRAELAELRALILSARERSSSPEGPR